MIRCFEMGRAMWKNRHGFTLVETLIVVAVLVILLTVSAAGVVGYLRQARITELDNAAREIYLAAQNRAILLQGSQRLERLVVRGDNRIEHVDVIPGAEASEEGTTQITVYYLHCEDSGMEDLLPWATIEPSLWKGDFYIVYEPESASVVDVFFSRETLSVSNDGSDFEDFYQRWRAAPRTDRMNQDPMIGYFGGQSAESGTSISLRTPVINIYNENTLWAEVTYWVPQTLILMGEDANVNLEVTLAYQGTSIALSLGPDGDSSATAENDIAYRSYTYTWLLDSLEGGHQFRDLFDDAGVTFGGDFEFTAEVAYDGGTLLVNGARKTAVDNSLFARGSGAETAYIACLRHLQNLDEAFSGVEGKTVAEQTADIPAVEGYPFQPIENRELRSYNGGQYVIRDLEIGTDAGSAGLFGAFSGTEENRKALTGIRLVNTAVRRGDAEFAGALVGTASQVKITDCLVYWENNADETSSLREVLGDSADGLRYQIVSDAGFSGGLAGALSDAEVTDSAAATLVSGRTAGGLVGRAENVAVSGSYADCYLTGRAAAGLFGSLAGAAEISNSYAAGFIASQAEDAAAGLCLGGGMAAVRRSYSAMLFSEGSINYPLCQAGTYAQTYYLDSERFGSQADSAHARTYAQLTNAALWDGLFGTGVFTQKSAADSHPYNLQTTLTLTRYIYPGLGTVAHYGDWGAQFQDGDLVYYEAYQDADGTSYGFSGGGVNYLLDDRTVVQDGYAVAYNNIDFNAALGVTLYVTYPGEAGAGVDETISYETGDMYTITGTNPLTNQEETYYLLPLQEEIVNTGYVSEDFYQTITIAETAESSRSGGRSYYFNPHFANAILPYEDGLDLSQQAHRLQVAVRTPRHLYMLSQFSAYYASDHQYLFQQELALNYTAYTGYNLFPSGPFSQSPIGADDRAPFRCTYDGGGLAITGVVPGGGGDSAYVGLFGYSSGVIRDVVYRMEDAPLTLTQAGSGTTAYVGALLGGNSGTVSNCAVSGVEITVNCYDYSTAYLGGLVGENRGSIRSSAAEAAQLYALCTMSNAYAGGFVGSNQSGGRIEQSYAVGRVSASLGRYGDVVAAGFAASSRGALAHSYAAAALEAEGGAVRYGFAGGESETCFYLNGGNFTYRDLHFAAQYEDGGEAKGATWSQLTASNGEAATALGMAFGAAALDGNDAAYPYPAAVTDGAGEPIHYGQWPEPTDLGDFGIFYWECMEIDGTDTYAISAIAAFDNENRTEKVSTLSTAHGDGGVVEAYGYGYYSLHGRGAAQTSRNISGEDSENQNAEDALMNLTEGQYTFCCYNTWGTAVDGRGLYPSGDTAGTDSSTPPSGTWTVTSEEASLTVWLNPFFADSMSVAAGSGWTVGESVPTALPGTADNPYGVRSIDQLQFINWNYQNRNTTTVLDNHTNRNEWQFLFLSYADGYGRTQRWVSRVYYWQQTHDLDGSEATDYTPIAAFRDGNPATTSQAYGWFGGCYNGNDYTIQNLDIFTTNVNTTGLFGFTLDAELQNIVLYDTEGDGIIQAANSGNNWYAMGGLVGLAANTANSTRTISNCAVAGYEIRDNNTGCAFGGGGVGGLVGICNMALENCTAVTDIHLDFWHSSSERNVRVGGLAGSCQQGITNCYAGGSIQAASGLSRRSSSRVHAGGIVGGYFMKTLQIGSTTIGANVSGSGGSDNPTIRNCYSYVQLPDQGDLPASTGNLATSSHLFAIGGRGEISLDGSTGNAAYRFRYENCFYLSGRLGSGTYLDVGAPGVSEASFAALSAGGDAYDALIGVGFAPVTTATASGDPIDGRYSFGTDRSLLGHNYPFPTILTQSSALAAGGVAHVHYGDWAVQGIQRENGALPVQLDLFADHQLGAGAVHSEVLTLSNLSGSGTWSVESADPAVAEAGLARLQTQGITNTLTITARRAGSTQVTITYQESGQTYTLTIDVNVTADLRLSAGGLLEMFVQEESATAALHWVDAAGNRLADDLAAAIDVTGFSVSYDTGRFAFAAVTEAENGDMVLNTSTLLEDGPAQMTVTYTFTYLGQTYTASSVLSLEMHPGFALNPVEAPFGGSQNQQSIPYDGTEITSIQVNDREVPVADVSIAGFEAVEGFQQQIFAQWADESAGRVEIIVSPPPQGIQEMTAYLRIQLRFAYGGCTHTLWQNLPIHITA